MVLEQRIGYETDEHREIRERYEERYDEHRDKVGGMRTRVTLGWTIGSGLVGLAAGALGGDYLADQSLDIGSFGEDLTMNDYKAMGIIGAGAGSLAGGLGYTVGDIRADQIRKVNYTPIWDQMHEDERAEHGEVNTRITEGRM